MPSFRDLVFGARVARDGDVKASGSLLDATSAAARSAGGVVWGNTASPGSGRFSGRSARQHLEAYAGREDAIGWVMICADLIANTASNSPFHFETDEGKELAINRAEAEKGARIAPLDLVQLMERPNPWESWEDLVFLAFVDWLVAGDFFFLKWGVDLDGKPAAIYRLNPSLVEVIPGGPNEPLIKGYQYAVPGMEKVTFSEEEVLHVKRPNPHSPYRGASVIAGDPRGFDTEISLTHTKAAYYEHGARLSGVLETDRVIEDGLVAKIRRQFMGTYSGASESYKVAVLQAGMKFKEISNSAVDAAFGEMGRESRDYIMAMFGIPKSMFGIENEGRAAEGYQAEDRREFANNKMRPMLDRFEKAITQAIIEPGWGLKLCIDYEYQMPVEEKLKLAEGFASLPGIMIKEVRGFVDLEPLGDERDDIVLNLPGNNENDSEVKDKSLGKEPGRTPNPENTAEVPKPGDELPPDAEAVPKPAS